MVAFPQDIEKIRYGVRCSIADQVVVGVGVISDTSGVFCGVSCADGEQAAIEKIEMTTAANGPNALEYFLNLTFPLHPLAHARQMEYYLL